MFFQGNTPRLLWESSSSRTKSGWASQWWNRAWFASFFTRASCFSKRYWHIYIKKVNYYSFYICFFFNLKDFWWNSVLNMYIKENCIYFMLLKLSQILQHYCCSLTIQRIYVINSSFLLLDSWPNCKLLSTEDLYYYFKQRHSAISY